jgi:hypothetical protein
LPPGAAGDVIETVNVTASRLSFESGAALHSPDIRMGTPDFGAAGGGGGEGVIEEVVTVATRIRPGGSVSVTPKVSAAPKCNKLIRAGNALARLSKKAGDASTGMIVGGAAVAAIGALGGQPQVTAAGAGAVHIGSARSGRHPAGVGRCRLSEYLECVVRRTHGWRRQVGRRGHAIRQYTRPECRSACHAPAVAQ